MHLHLCSVRAMGMGKRIRHFREKAGLKLQQLAALSGVDTGTISALEIRDSTRSQFFSALAAALGMTVEQLGDESYDPELLVVLDKEAGWARQVVRVYPKPEDGVDGETPPVSRGHGPSSYGMQPILAWEHEDDLPAGEFVMIPRLDVHLSAGGGKEQVEIEFSDVQPQAFRADWIRKKRLKPKKLASMIADGDSMEERIHDGDALVVDTSQTNVVDGKVYALWYEGGERVKRLYRLPGGGLRIVSDNQKYQPIELTAGTVAHVRIIGRIVHISGEGGL